MILTSKNAAELLGLKGQLIVVTLGYKIHEELSLEL